MSDRIAAEYEAVYAYKAGKSGHRGVCAYYPGDGSPVSVSDYATVTPDNVAQMKAALAKQPLAVSIEADKKVF